MKEQILRRKKRVRSKMPRRGFRLNVSRSNRFVFGQIINQENGQTILGLWEKKALSEKEAKGKTKTERARQLGIKIAQQAKAKKITRVVFDRGPFQYRGRVKAFAEGAREGGLEF